MKIYPRRLELLAPASNADIAIQAIMHGADAVYIGPSSHGARKSASNSIEDIRRVVEYAHEYHAKVYATVNTIVYDNEISVVEKMCRELYHANVDALIVQDMGILRMNIPPIALHASTQCDIRTPEKAKFLEEIGFSQLVLARELSLQEIRSITEAVTIPVEVFVHGALCVSYSGRCHASLALNGRSANRGECAQICRYPYTLTDAEGKIIVKDKYLLSLKDFNASHNLKDLIEAGVSSFKIEGRLKDIGYVKNITALYNTRLNQIVCSNPDKYVRTSFGSIELKFKPKADKSFNRGYTNYFLENRRPLQIASLDTSKSQGEKIHNIRDLNNGDGISFYNREGIFTGVNINRVKGNKIIPSRKIEIPKKCEIYRTSDIKWEKFINGKTSIKKIELSIKIDNKGVTAKDERGNIVRLPLPHFYENALHPMNYKPVFEKIGYSIYFLKNYESKLDEMRFYRASEMTVLRRRLLDLLAICNKATYPFEYRKTENKGVLYPYVKLDYRDNVANNLAVKFYREHGVNQIEKAAEVTGNLKEGSVVMTTRHCILRELGMCSKEKRKSAKLRFPLYLNYAGGRFLLEFNCKSCEMEVKLD